ncbi:uncharacterized protein LOC143182925 [Calliopsis andreniformis]|uniref:uncharacterized protein LOC143182925 n=1 Tax=Calliopsis andreniformis TaxID=337506 RepID=UPI003FCCEB44
MLEPQGQLEDSGFFGPASLKGRRDEGSNSLDDFRVVTPFFRDSICSFSANRRTSYCNQLPLFLPRDELEPRQKVEYLFVGNSRPSLNQSFRLVTNRKSSLERLVFPADATMGRLILTTNNRSHVLCKNTLE